jgi:hypothetical protein
MLYVGVGVLEPVLWMLFPQYVTTTEILGRAMIKVAKHGALTPIIESNDISIQEISKVTRV